MLLEDCLTFVVFLGLLFATNWLFFKVFFGHFGRVLQVVLILAIALVTFERDWIIHTILQRERALRRVRRNLDRH